MIKFKFFRGYIGTLGMISGVNYSTTSLNTLDNVMEHNRLQRELFTVHERVIREHNVMERAADRIFLSNVTRVTTVNPTPWTKVKIFGTKVKLALNVLWKQEPMFVLITTGVLFSFAYYWFVRLFG